MPSFDMIQLQLLRDTFPFKNWDKTVVPTLITLLKDTHNFCSLEFSRDKKCVYFDDFKTEKCNFHFMSPIEFLIRPDIVNVLSCHTLGFETIGGDCGYGNLAYIQNPSWGCIAISKAITEKTAAMRTEFSEKFGDILRLFPLPNIVATVNFCVGECNGSPAIMFTRVYGDTDFFQKYAANAIVNYFKDNYLVCAQVKWYSSFSDKIVNPETFTSFDKSNFFFWGKKSNGLLIGNGHMRYADIEDYDAYWDSVYHQLYIEEKHKVILLDATTKRIMPNIIRHNLEPSNVVINITEPVFPLASYKTVTCSCCYAQIDCIDDLYFDQENCVCHSCYQITTVLEDELLAAFRN